MRPSSDRGRVSPKTITNNYIGDGSLAAGERNNGKNLDTGIEKGKKRLREVKRSLPSFVVDER